MRKQTVLTISGVTVATAAAIGLLVYKATQKKVEVQPPYIGMGGSCGLKYPYNLTINSFREWDHYHEPGTGEPDTLPSHRFWTWGKLDRPGGTPAGLCMGGYNNNPDHATIDLIFNCDKPIIDEMVGKYPGAMHGIGNEPNFAPTITVANYAYQFHKYERYIHSIDPTAQMLNGGITLPVPWKIWTIEFIQKYQGLYGVKPPVDIWVIHPYAEGWPNGKTAALAGSEYVKDFRVFLNNQGYENTSILIGEFSDASGTNTEYQLARYAETFCDWIVANENTHNIVGWYWWGSSNVAMGNAGLFDANRNITQVGEAYIKHCGLYKFKTYLPLIIK